MSTGKLRHFHSPHFQLDRAVDFVALLAVLIDVGQQLGAEVLLVGCLLVRLLQSHFRSLDVLQKRLAYLFSISEKQPRLLVRLQYSRNKNKGQPHGSDNPVGEGFQLTLSHLVGEHRQNEQGVAAQQYLVEAKLYFDLDGVSEVLSKHDEGH